MPGSTDCLDSATEIAAFHCPVQLLVLVAMCTMEFDSCDELPHDLFCSFQSYIAFWFGLHVCADWRRDVQIPSNQARREKRQASRRGGVEGKVRDVTRCESAEQTCCKEKQNSAQ